MKRLLTIVATIAVAAVLIHVVYLVESAGLERMRRLDTADIQAIQEQMKAVGEKGARIQSLRGTCYLIQPHAYNSISYASAKVSGRADGSITVDVNKQ